MRAIEDLTGWGQTRLTKWDRAGAGSPSELKVEAKGHRKAVFQWGQPWDRCTVGASVEVLEGS